MWSLCLYTTARVPSLISKSFRSHRGITTCPFTVNDTVSVFDVGFIIGKSYSITKSKSNKDLLEIYMMVRPFRSRLAWPGKRVTIRLFGFRCDPPMRKTSAWHPSLPRLQRDESNNICAGHRTRGHCALSAMLTVSQLSKPHSEIETEFVPLTS